MKSIIASLFAVILLAGCLPLEVVDETPVSTNDNIATGSVFDVVTEGCGEHLYPGAPGGPDQLLCRDAFALHISPTTKVASWVSYHITAESVSGYTERNENFREDTEVPAEYRATLSDYYGSGYDRGHMAPAATVDYSYTAMDDSFLLSNITPQQPGFNRYGWADLEAWVRSCAQEVGELYVVTGSVFDSTPRHIGNFVEVPDMFYKVLLDPATGRTTAFLVPHQDIRASDLPSFVTTVDAVEEAAGYDLFANLRDDIEIQSEATQIPICFLEGYSVM